MNFLADILDLLPRCKKNRRCLNRDAYIGLERRSAHHLTKEELQKEVNERFDNLATIMNQSLSGNQK